MTAQLSSFDRPLGADVIPERPFGVALTEAVADTLDPGVIGQARRRLHRKALVVLAWWAGSFAVLVASPNIWIGMVACLSFAMSIAAVGFNIQHDANHNAFFDTAGTKRLSAANRTAGLSLNMIGGSAKRWIDGHVLQHHAAPNVVGKDFDIELAPFARMAPTQRWRPWHRIQHLYMWIVYGASAIGIIAGDVVNTFVESSSGDRHGNKPTAGDYLAMAFSKGLFVAVMLGVPLIWHPVWVVAVGAVVVLALSGVILGVVFQLAHVVETAEFRDASDPAQYRWHEWQVRSSADFCQGDGPVSRVVTWYFGGLNYQREHHLFPTLPHTLYPTIAPTVERVCADYGIACTTNVTLRDALGSHYRHLRTMGQPPIPEK